MSVLFSARSVLTSVMVVAFWLVGAPAVLAQDTPGRAGDLTQSPMISFLFMTPIGWLLIATYLFFVGLLVWLIIDLRAANFMPADFVERLDEHLRNKQLKEGFELAKNEHSPFGKVMTAGMARLSAGLQEARDAAEFIIESAKNRKDALLGYMAVLGTLGPLIGLVGTVSGMIDTFAVLGRGTTPNVGELASGISHALNATLVGIFLSVLAIPVFTYFKNRLSRIVIDASLLADDLLTQTYYSSRKPDGPSVTGSGPATAAARAVPLPPKPDAK
jgi:biopolymer transport protein ExbB